MANNKSRILSIDVECIAINFTHDGRSPCSVAVVDDQCKTIFSSLIKPAEKVVSDLYPITGLRIKDLEHAPSFEEVLQKVKENFFLLKKNKLIIFRFILYWIRQQLLLVKDHKVIFIG